MVDWSVLKISCMVMSAETKRAYAAEYTSTKVLSHAL